MNSAAKSPKSCVLNSSESSNVENSVLDEVVGSTSASATTTAAAVLPSVSDESSSHHQQQPPPLVEPCIVTEDRNKRAFSSCNSVAHVERMVDSKMESNSRAHRSVPHMNNRADAEFENDRILADNAANDDKHKDGSVNNDRELHEIVFSVAMNEYNEKSNIDDCPPPPCLDTRRSIDESEIDDDDHHHQLMEWNSVDADNSTIATTPSMLLSTTTQLSTLLPQLPSAYHRSPPQQIYSSNIVSPMQSLGNRDSSIRRTTTNSDVVPVV